MRPNKIEKRAKKRKTDANIFLRLILKTPNPPKSKIKKPPHKRGQYVNYYYQIRNLLRKTPSTSLALLPSHSISSFEKIKTPRVKIPGAIIKNHGATRLQAPKRAPHSANVYSPSQITVCRRQSLLDFKVEGCAQKTPNRAGPTGHSARSDGLGTSRLTEPELMVVSALLSG